MVTGAVRTFDRASGVFASQLEDSEAVRGLERIDWSRALHAEGPGTPESPVEAVRRLQDGTARLEMPTPDEAIVMKHGYPSLLIQRGDYDEPLNPVWQERLAPHRDTIKQVIQNVGRIDLVGHPHHQWVGTAWRVEEDTLVTNRHVAQFFVQARNGDYGLHERVKAYVDFAEEHLVDEELEALVNRVVHVEPASDDAVDIALVKFDRSAAPFLDGIAPVALSTKRKPEFVGVIGYPARDVRNPHDAMMRIYRGIFDVKRLAPGRIVDPSFASHVFTHNCTTLGGNSGSVVFDLATGQAVGLHFAGSALEANYAVKASAVAKALERPTVRVNGKRNTSPGPSPERGDDLHGRNGYQPHFIGDGDLSVPLPVLNPLQASRAARTSTGQIVLKYRHFSAVVNEERRLAYFTACNIDGNSLRRPRRVRSFRLDPRLDAAQQAGEELYRANDLDRGHLIRRLDPCWGEHANEANRDSMFFPNIAPQHKDLNQRVWLDLEDHILSLTDDEDARVSVFVGCLFGSDDPVHQSTGIRVPLGFWKVVASIGQRRCGRSTRRELQAQAFVLSQEALVNDDDLEIVFGDGFGTHQVTVESLERMTGLDFGVLRRADTFGLPPEMQPTSAEWPVHGAGDVVRPLERVEDVVL